jgi:predicted oxidoreductase
MSQLPAVPPMRPLGGSGVSVSSIAWGMWRFQGEDLSAARALVDAALEIGVNLFDTADIYGVDAPAGFGSAEALLGRVFEAAPGLRDTLFLATKGGIIPGVPYDSSETYLEAAIDASLRRLKVEQIDLWQVHRPDILTHPQEVARAMEKAHAAGKVDLFGVSNFTLAQTQALRDLAPASVNICATQPELSPLCLDPIVDGTLDYAMTEDLAVLAWSPLGGGRIAAPTNAREEAVAAALDAVAGPAGVSRTAAAYSWIMAHPARPIPIVGSQRPDRIREAADAYKVSWSRAQWYAVQVAARGAPLP